MVMTIKGTLITIITTLLLASAQFHRLERSKSNFTEEYLRILEENKDKRIDNVVVWDKVHKVCIPDICQGKHLDDIPDYDGVIPAQFLKDTFASNYTLFDMNEIEKCFQNKKIVFFGDSTMTEFVLSMFYVLTGIFRPEHQDDWGVYCTHTMAKQLDKTYTDHFKFDGVPEFYVNIGVYGHRNFSLHMPAMNTQIYHRFNGGGNDINHNFGGIKQMLEHMPEDFLCFLGNDGCPVPDVIVYQSGHHDVGDWLGTIEQMPKLFKLLQDAKKRGAKVFWKSSSDNYGPSHRDVMIGAMNQAAELLSYEYDIEYINIDTARDMFGKYYDTRDYLEGHTGPHSGFIGGNNHPDHPLTYLMWKVMFILNHICPK